MRRMLSKRNPGPVAMWLLGIVLAANTALGAAFPQADSDSLFQQATEAYQRNQFNVASKTFQQVTGTHAQEARDYVTKIKTYLDAQQVATTILERSPDERDAPSLHYAIEKLQIEISIKPDGPGNPQQQLQKARQIKAQIDQAQSGNERSLCDRAMAAATAHHYQEAADLSCLLADEKPAFSCSGNEAVFLCQQNRGMEKMGSVPAPKVSSVRSEPVTETRSADLDRAREAYNSNNFDRARALLQRVSGEAKQEADQLLDKISRYSDAVANGEKLARESRYDEARQAFLNAASIKPDGPSDPQAQAASMELYTGIDQFYSGDYATATQHLEACAAAKTGKQALVHFYLGASKLAHFYAGGESDAGLRQDALNEFKLAKKAGFNADEQKVSPKILEAYRNLTN